MQGEMWRGRQDDWDLLRKWAECHSVVLALVSPPRPSSHVCGSGNTKHAKHTLCYLGDRVLHDEHVGHVAELAEVLPQFVLTGLPTEAPDEELARGGVGGGGGPARGLSLAAELIRPGGGGGEGQPGQLVHGEPGEGKSELG